MKKKTINKITLFTALGLGAIVLISCTNNFSSNTDKSCIMYAYDMGSTRYAAESDLKPDGTEKLKIDGIEFANVYAWQDYCYDYHGGYARTLSHTDTQGVVASAISSKIEIPSNEYWLRMDQKTLKKAWETTWEMSNKSDKPEEQQWSLDHQKDILSEASTVTKDDIIYVLDLYGPIKFAGQNDKGEIAPWTNWDNWTNELRKDESEGGIGYKNVPNTDFTNLYKSFINTKVNNVRSCITIGGGYYGNFGWNHNTVHMEDKTWGYAWSKGFLEGLLVYPVAAMTEIFAHYFGMGGWGQLGAILLVTFIVRTFLALVSLKSTVGQQKMQMLQPELAKIQAKYPNADSNPAQKQRLSQEQMALYKKNKINPLGTLLVLVVQFPLFIGVWGGLQGSAALATDKFAGLYLSESIWNTLTNTIGLPSNVNGWWTALVLFILMAISQFVSMKLPQWMQKAREKKMPKLSANPAQSKSQKQMKWFGYIMLVMIIFMGFTLPAGMGVYWLAGALFSIIQTFITQLAISGTFKRWFHKIKSLFKKKEVNNNENI
ncbi:MAG: YidC/Oxa1 family membrane protein insertase [Bacilli bacterium]|nr:YidC/Oxa1 family membrane protein insertase [Bacilli bacterium]